MIETNIKHLGIIMDGNGRWATSKGMKRTEGHKRGGKTLVKLLEYIKKTDIKILSVYAFATDNFKRDEEEVNALMELFLEYFNNYFNKLSSEGIKIVFSGRDEPLKKDIIETMRKIEKKSANNDKFIFNICLNYNSKFEIADMVKKISKMVKENEISELQITDELVNKCMYNELPPLDYVIRTSGEQRISNFMLYQSAYAEYYFPEIYFPDFDEAEFEKAMNIFKSRDRRFGAVKSK